MSSLNVVIVSVISRVLYPCISEALVYILNRTRFKYVKIVIKLLLILMGSPHTFDRSSNTQYANMPQRQTGEIGDNTTTPSIYQRVLRAYNCARNDVQNDYDRHTNSSHPNIHQCGNSSDIYNNIRARTSQMPSELVYDRIDSGPIYSMQRNSPSYSRDQGTRSSRQTPSHTYSSSTPIPRPDNIMWSQPLVSTSRQYLSKGLRNANNVYNCSTCNNRFGLDIFNCPDGHSSCKDCLLQGRACGICGLHITNTRNYAVQEFIAQTRVSCPNARDGCKLQLKIIEMDLHVSECPFAEMVCPLYSIYGNCRWRGKLSHILAHFDEHHPEERQGGVNTELILPNIYNESHILYFIPLGSYYFTFHVKVDVSKRCVLMTVQLLGTSMSAAKWIYEVHIYNKKEPRRKYTYMSPCTPTTIPVKDIFNNAECAVLPLQYAINFINEGLLNYKFYIKNINYNFSVIDGNDNTQRINYNDTNLRGIWTGRDGLHRRVNN